MIHDMMQIFICFCMNYMNHVLLPFELSHSHTILNIIPLHTASVIVQGSNSRMSSCIYRTKILIAQS